MTSDFDALKDDMDEFMLAHGVEMPEFKLDALSASGPRRTRLTPVVVGCEGHDPALRQTTGQLAHSEG